MRNKNFSIDKNICYLCSLTGADTKDHIPPKSLFNTGGQRLTLPAHQKCNSEFSEDEEYFRDVIIQQSSAFNLRNIENITEKIFRSWRSTGINRYKKLILTATRSLIKNRAGDFKEFLLIKPDNDILSRVAVKIARGIIYNDTGVVTLPSNYSCTYLPIIEVPILKLKDEDQLFWKILRSDHCLHTTFGPYFGARRAYIFSDMEIDKHTVTCMMGLILGSAFYLIDVSFPFSQIKNKHLHFFML